jgi:RNA-splicing ligase RtcB
MFKIPSSLLPFEQLTWHNTGRLLSTAKSSKKHKKKKTRTQTKKEKKKKRKTEKQENFAALASPIPKISRQIATRNL